MLPPALPAESASSSAATARNERLVADAKAVVADLASDKFDAVAARFDAKMTAALSVEKLRSTWQSLVAQVGEFRRAGDAQASEHDGFFVVVIPCEFASATFDAKIAYDADGKMAGLFLTPHAPPPSAYVAPGYVDPAAFAERDARVGTGALALEATLSMPKTPGEHVGVVLVHGSGPHDRDETIGPNRVFRDLAGGLASRGIAVLRYEKRTQAHPEAFGSKDFTVDDETVNDALAAAALLRTTDGVDPHRVYVAGHSLGAMMAPRIAQRDGKLAGLILLAPPARPLEDIVVDQQRYLASLDREHGDAEREKALAEIVRGRDEIKRLDAETPPARPLLLGLPAHYWLDLRDYDPVAVARALSVPILVLQGARDFQVTAPDYSRWQSACAATSRIACKSYPELNHLFIAGAGASTPAEYSVAGHVAAAVVEDMAAWVQPHAPRA